MVIGSLYIKQLNSPIFYLFFNYFNIIISNIFNLYHNQNNYKVSDNERYDRISAFKNKV